MMKLGHNYDSLKPVSYEGAVFLRDMGVEVVALSVALAPTAPGNPALIPSPGVYDWSRPDHDINTLVRAGLKVFPHLQWLPRLWTGGLPVNEPYEAVNWQKDWHDWTAVERPWLWHPNLPPVDSGAIQEFGSAFTKRYERYLEAISFWNEPDIRIFYPQKDAPVGWLNAMRDPLYLGMWAPFMRGVRSVSRILRIVGPSVAYPGTLELFLQLEKEHAGATAPHNGCQRCGQPDRSIAHIESHNFVPGPAYVPPYDVLAFHCYSDVKPPTVESSVAAAKDYRGVLERNGAKGRPAWITEYAADDYMSAPEKFEDPVEWTRALMEVFPEAVPFPYLSGQWCEGGTAAWDAGRFKPNAKYFEMRKLVRGARRRAVRA